jgi:hypothetical protein
MAASLAVLLLGATAAAAAPLGHRPKWHELTADYSYETYRAHFGKAASDSAENIFSAKLTEILAHNADPAQTWKMGVNQFTDLSDVQFRARLASPAAIAAARAGAGGLPDAAEPLALGAVQGLI